MLSPRAKPLDEVLNGILEHCRIQFVHDVLAVPLGENELGILEHAQVTGYRRPARCEFRSDLAGRSWSGTQELEDLSSGGVGKRAEYVVHKFS
jgi:hypothetical protein